MAIGSFLFFGAPYSTFTIIHVFISRIIEPKVSLPSISLSLRKYSSLAIMRHSLYGHALKPFLDFACSLLCLILFFPLLLLVVLLAYLNLGYPIFYRQQRPGHFARPFQLLKFRTMTNQRDAHGELLPDAQRLTPFGRWLRSSSIDELPGLVNILRGEMSFIGPRPLLMQYLPLYSPEQARRHDLKPGFSGWAQINGRNAISWEEKFRLDVWYVDNQSFWLDLRIFVITIWKVVRREGISPKEILIMPNFQGSNSDSISIYSK